jgi:hypothetical protein
MQTNNKKDNSRENHTGTVNYGTWHDDVVPYMYRYRSDIDRDLSALSLPYIHFI